MKQLYKYECKECGEYSIYDHDTSWHCRSCGSWALKEPERLEGQELREAHKNYEEYKIGERSSLLS